LFDHASAADSESDDAENREFDETGSADQRRKAWQRDQKERGRLARFLARRGFSGAIASRAIKIGLSGQQQNDDEC
jgi:SOS response regulatory protein OraA/RecX